MTAAWEMVSIRRCNDGRGVGQPILKIMNLFVLSLLPTVMVKPRSIQKRCENATKAVAPTHAEKRKASRTANNQSASASSASTGPAAQPWPCSCLGPCPSQSLASSPSMANKKCTPALTAKKNWPNTATEKYNFIHALIAQMHKHVMRTQAPRKLLEDSWDTPGRLLGSS